MTPRRTVRCATPGCPSAWALTDPDDRPRYCRLCRDRRAQETEERRRTTRLAEGICLTCPTPAEPGLRRCTRCLARGRSRAAASHAKRSP